MTTKEEKLYSFYSQCAAKGYTDMTDDTQSLKAKVIASDLGLRYGKIIALYEEAKAVFEAEEARRRAAVKRAAEEAARTSVPGELVVTLKDDSASIEVFRRPDSSVYCTHNGGTEKFEGAPDLEVRKGGVLSYTYHPSKTVFTGASSGGIAMGGFHQTEAYSTEKVSGTGTGDIHARSGNMDIWVKYANFSDATDKAFRRDDTYIRLSRGKQIVCFDSKKESSARNLINTAVNNRAGYQQAMSTASMALDMMRLPIGQVQIIAGLLNDVLSGRYPETDEQYYAKALTLSQSGRSDELQNAVRIFRKISDYKDSSVRADAVQKKYEDVLQFEKEQKILAKEEKGRKLKKTIMIAAPVIAAAAIAGFLFSGQAKKTAAYNSAVQLMEAGEYDDAIDAFTAMNGYKDSAGLITECRYRAAMDVISCMDREDPGQIVSGAVLESIPSGDENLKRINVLNTFFKEEAFKDACIELERLGDYKDCREVIARLNKQQEAVSLMFTSFKKAAPLVEELPEDDLLRKSIMEIISRYEPYLGKFYWMGSKNMEADFDFRLFNRPLTQVGWEYPYARVTMSDGETIQFPSLKLDGKLYGLFDSITLSGLSASGAIQNVIEVKVNFKDGYITADMYYDTADGQKLGDSFYACPDDPELMAAGEKYYKAQKEKINLDQAEQYIKKQNYGKAKKYLDQLPDSSKKESMLASIEMYLPYLGSWELVSGEATLLNDEKNTKREFKTISTDTSREKSKFYVDVFDDEGKVIKRFKTEETPYSSGTYRDKNAAQIQYFLSVAPSGNLLVTEVKNGSRTTAEYKKTE